MVRLLAYLPYFLTFLVVTVSSIFFCNIMPLEDGTAEAGSGSWLI